MCKVRLKLCSCCEVSVSFDYLQMRACQNVFWGKCRRKYVNWTGPFVCESCMRNHSMHNLHVTRCTLISDERRQFLRTRPYLELTYKSWVGFESMLVSLDRGECIRPH